jgi:glycosyltransferase involved in cell wall biosynthesis
MGGSVIGDFAILYWGKRGGGLDLTYSMISGFEKLGLKTNCSSRAFESNPDSVQAPSSLLSVFKWIYLRKRIPKLLNNLDTKTVIVPMSSPWDLFLRKKLTKNNIKLIRIIHDAEPHPGDYWPTKSWIKFLCRDADHVVFLSHYVEAKLYRYIDLNSQKITVASLPPPKIELDFMALKKSNFPKKNHENYKVLFLGRGKKYKGQKILEVAWEDLQNVHASLKIIGEGHFINKKSQNIDYDLRWYSHEDLLIEIDSHDLIVLPYIEASQSGIIPICHALGKPVIATNVGGLPEQIADGLNGFIVTPNDPKILSETILKAINYNWDYEKIKSDYSAEDFIRKILF